MRPMTRPMTSRAMSAVQSNTLVVAVPTPLTTVASLPKMPENGATNGVLQVYTQCTKAFSPFAPSSRSKNLSPMSVSINPPMV